MTTASLPPLRPLAGGVYTGQEPILTASPLLATYARSDLNVSETIEKTIIIGSGPAGWSAAIYAARANLNPVVYEGTYKPEMIPLGQLAFTTEVENYAGFPAGNVRAFVESAVSKDRHYNLPPAPAGHEKDGQPHYAVQGTELMELMKQQALNFGTRVISDDIESVDFAEAGPHTLKPASGEPVKAHTVIIATGARANYLGLPSEEEYKNKGVSACAVCDGALPIYRSRPLAVVGAGDSAVEEATYLANLKDAATIYMIVRRDEMRASKVMQDRAKNHPKIEILWNSVVSEVVGDGKLVTGVKIASTVDDSTRDLEVGGMFVAIGHTPNTAFLGGAVDMNESGYIQWAKPFRTNTNIRAVFAAGDVADDYYRQAITSAGTGCMAALDAERYLAEQE
ncbi:Thioredoxin reductase [Rubripirellula lacrimiformis]|uniref:Thioredoxin reductase n=1 Tax=Rubripirellula lacrimiformis TaxID=1930273 RepID=A0A517N810_9BACT|nr:Thioredoxin reductase [Rubripirellula lacrimiformis]